VFRAADCDTDHHLMVAKVREILAVSKQTMHIFYMDMFNLKKLSKMVKKSITLKSLHNFGKLRC
jgi:hypothetical protein